MGVGFKRVIRTAHGQGGRRHRRGTDAAGYCLDPYFLWFVHRIYGNVRTLWEMAGTVCKVREEQDKGDGET